MNTTKATILERGNGMPSVGAYVPGDDGNLYRVESIDSRIQTGQPGQNWWVNATVALVDWDDCAEADEFPALVVLDGLIRCRITAGRDDGEPICKHSQKGRAG